MISGGSQQCIHFHIADAVSQLGYLRMRRAAELLATTEHTIEAIAYEIGYHNPFVFSNAFTKWIGWRPSEYRRKRGIVVRGPVTLLQR